MVGVGKDTVEILGKEFLKCHQEECEWNIGLLAGGEWTELPGKGTRICNLGAKAIIETEAMPPVSCQQQRLVFQLAQAEIEF